MGLFSFLKSDKPVYSDKVWKTRHFAWRGMLTDALYAITQNQVPIVFTFFEKSQNQLVDFLKQNQVPFYELNSDSVGNADTQDKVVLVANGNSFASSSSLDSFFKSLAAKTKVVILFSSHYPLPAPEQKIIRKLNALLPNSITTFYSSLDEPIFDLFGGDNLTSLLEKLGMKEDEAIEHSMVSRSMERARQKLETMVKHETVAHSQEEWFRRNVKPQ